jgi:hypothetical protein
MKKAKMPRAVRMKGSVAVGVVLTYRACNGCPCVRMYSRYRAQKTERLRNEKNTSLVPVISEETKKKKRDMLAERSTSRLECFAETLKSDTSKIAPPPKDIPSAVHHKFRDRDPSKELGPSTIRPNRYVSERDRITMTQEHWKFVPQMGYTGADAFKLRVRERSKEIGAEFRFGDKTEGERINNAISRQNVNVSGQWDPPEMRRFREEDKMEEVGPRFKLSVRHDPKHPGYTNISGVYAGNSHDNLARSLRPRQRDLDLTTEFISTVNTAAPRMSTPNSLPPMRDETHYKSLASLVYPASGVRTKAASVANDVIRMQKGHMERT